MTTEEPWQPIETAPKDGTKILLKGPGGETLGYWHGGAWVGKVKAYHAGHFGGYLSFNEAHQPTQWRSWRP